MIYDIRYIHEIKKGYRVKDTLNTLFDELRNDCNAILSIALEGNSHLLYRSRKKLKWPSFYSKVKLKRHTIQSK